jgi:hypothetical protein
VKIKYDVDPDTTPEMKSIGSKKGKAGEIDYHIIGLGDGIVYAIDQAGNQSDDVPFDD